MDIFIEKISHKRQNNEGKNKKIHEYTRRPFRCLASPEQEEAI